MMNFVDTQIADQSVQYAKQCYNKETKSESTIYCEKIEHIEEVKWTSFCKENKM